MEPAQARLPRGMLAYPFFWYGFYLCYDWKTLFPLTISGCHSLKTWKRREDCGGGSRRNKSLDPVLEEALGLKICRGQRLFSVL